LGIVAPIIIEGRGNKDEITSCSLMGAGEIDIGVVRPGPEAVCKIAVFILA
jgi:hypothetical protein